MSTHRQEVDALRREREHNEIGLRRTPPKFGAANFSRSVTAGTSVYTVEAASVMCSHREATCASAIVNVLRWDGKKFDWANCPGLLVSDPTKERSVSLTQGTPESWLLAFYGSAQRPSVSVGLKVGAKRRQAKLDREILRYQPCFIFPSSEIASAYEAVISAGQKLAKSALGVAHHGEVYLDPLTGRKGFGGATKLVANGALSVSTALPERASTNFVPLLFEVENRNIFLLPHLIVAQSGSETAGRSYDAVRLEVSEWEMQVNYVPPEAEFLGYVWRFMNKDGGPDRRYNDNYQIPVIRAWEIDFHIRDVGELHLAFSSREAVHSFKSAYEKFVKLVA